jgi:mono/diheme cytochrome c family protein
MKKITIVLFLFIFSFTVTLSFNYIYGIPHQGREINKDLQVTEGDKGVGPFKEVKLAPVDQAKVRKGLNVFMQKCFLCHELDNKKLGPPLRNITKQETPEFILNMIVNPVGMQKENAKVKEQMKKYNNLLMLDQQISKEDAMNILDYLRSVAK